MRADDVDRLYLQDVVLSEHVAGVSGGAMFVNADAATFERVHVEGSSAPSGGGLFVQDTRATILDCVFDSNDADLGGAITVQGGTTLAQRSIFHNNAADLGATGFASGGTLRIEHSVSVGDHGGSALYNLTGSLDLVNSAFVEPNVGTLFEGDATWAAHHTLLMGTDASQASGIAFELMEEGLVPSTTGFLRVNADGRPNNDLLAPAMGDAAHNTGLVTRLDADGSRSDIGPHGGAALGRASRIRDGDLDGLDDLWELHAGSDPTLADAYLDIDEDGLNASQEYALATDPTRSDSDADGVTDDADEHPTDPIGQRVSLTPTLTATDAGAFVVAAYGTSPFAEEVVISWRIANVPESSTVTTDDVSTPSDYISYDNPDYCDSVAIGCYDARFAWDVPGVYLLEATADDGYSTETASIALVHED